ncbi:UDP-3-O-[3-hydroxymyristoyl] glucosamine N-acyltransferase [Marinomonas sp. MED121]|uniref:UDP-3-O-(3-hydroxymyristoyl)glucosamine N-acyltransferase n=1 Tax=Marinomonas sp. MED121 TaxID=314277 RepID=UPI0000690070|nr:UDP-3-O-(3-hydroxymyristoyl)glucosamine N-acyltransferase [Marinomonas sp. MED121]EAQ65696.1 UDP-3-O-[3-hydroxymyristoyl] glucosamine N-acyltransferase [Marinomonas sp. MED121]
MRKNTVVNSFTIKWLNSIGIVCGRIILAPYDLVSISDFQDFSISFLSKSDDWIFDKDDLNAIVLVKKLPNNYQNFKNIVFIRTDAPRDVFSFWMQNNISTIASAWYERKTLNYIHPTAKIHPTANILDNVYIDSNVEIGPQSTIGYSGFGYGRLDSTPYRLTHLGGVVIKEHTKINAHVTVASGTFLPTVIGENVIIDDHVHIAHNCQIGDESTITAGATLSGSVNMAGKNWLGPNSSIINGASLGEGVFIGIGSSVTKSFDSGTVAGNPAKKLRI